ncbi:MAG: acyl-CoA/acyl-ACP dehydrogenase [Chloroflexi bacterium]|nr:acyl-CoA/acyl-ACP dehydrogenase [Chloroflexota bacterium]
MLQATVRRFVHEEVLPLEVGMDPEAVDISQADWDRLAHKAKAAGLWCLGVAREYGGGGLSVFGQCVVAEETAQHRNGFYNPAYSAFGRPPPPIIFAGTPAQIQKYGVPTVREAHKTFFAITEPSGGSDPATAIETRGVKQDGRWVLNGTKVFISGAHEAQWGVLFARTGGPGHRGISCFIMETSYPGFTVRPVPVIRPWYPNEIVLQDCPVPEENLLGEENRGFDLVAKLLGYLRFPYSAASVGVAAAALGMAIHHAKERVTFGQPLAQRQAIQWMLADSEMEVRAARWLTWEGAWKADRGEDYRQEASIAKVFSSEVLGRVVDRSIQIHGGYGVSKALPLERWYREARVRRLGEGPSEVHRMVIARNLLR